MSDYREPKHSKFLVKGSADIEVVAQDHDCADQMVGMMGSTITGVLTVGVGDHERRFPITIVSTHPTACVNRNNDPLVPCDEHADQYDEKGFYR